MTPKEELIQAIETSPDDAILVLLRTLKRLQIQPSTQIQTDAVDLGADFVDMEQPPEQISGRLREKGGFLVVETEGLENSGIVDFIKEMREERMQKFIDRAGL